MLTNRGGGNFRRRDYRTGASPNDVAIGDLNGDGRADLAVANNDASTVSVLTNRSGGNFRRLNYRADESPRSIGIGDVTQDGKLDLVLVSGDETVSVFANNGRGGFRPKSIINLAPIPATLRSAT